MVQTIWTNDLDSKTYQDALKIRYEVFVEEQNVPEELEIDDLEEQSHHVVLYQDDQPLGTARIYHQGDGVYKIQRVAVLNTQRGQGLGAQLMQACEQKIQQLQGTKMTLGAQLQALPFYEKLVYTVEGPEFMDAGIPHRTVTKTVKKY